MDEPHKGLFRKDIQTITKYWIKINSYPQSENMLIYKDIMKIKFIGITGGSGAGKSTLCNALKNK